MRFLLPIGLCFALAAPCLTAQTTGKTTDPPASFDCAKATTPQEKAICASPELRKADAAMGEAFRAWLSAAPSAQWKDDIRANQRFWVKQRLSSCIDRGKFTMSQCLLLDEQDRTKTLVNMVQHDNGISFVWRAVNFTAPDSADIRADRVKYGQPDHGYVNATWPEAQSTAPEWAAWNKTVADAARDAARLMDTKPGVAWAKDWASDRDVNVTISLDTVTASYISATVSNSIYEHGAAHGMSGIVQLNWLLKEQRKLKADDVFQPQSNWQSELYNRTDKYLHSQLDANNGGNYQDWLGKPEEMVKTVHEILADPANWQIDEKGITIVFNPYAVACYACTPEPFTMSWNSLKPLLQPGFVPPSDEQ